MNKFFSKRFGNIFVFAVILIAFAVGSCNLFLKGIPDFFQMNLYQIISLTLVVIVSFFLVQKAQDFRKKQEIYINLIEKVVIDIDKLDLEALKSENSKFFISRQRAIENTLSLLNKHSKEFNIKNEIEYLLERNKEIGDMVSTHISHIDVLENIYPDIERQKESMRSKCNFILIKMYFE